MYGMCHPSKLEFLKQAKKSRFKIYLYFIATKNPAINIERVDNRVEEGGHSVPKDKIESRTLLLLRNLVNPFLLPYLFCKLDRAYHSTSYLAEDTIT